MSAGAIARAVLVTAGVIAVLVALWAARDALIIIYVSGLFATGLRPIVQRVQVVVPQGATRLPRWLAVLLIYLAIVGALTVVGLLIVPPIVQQAQELYKRLPELLDGAQSFLVRHRVIDHPITLEEAVRNAPGPGEAVGTVASAVRTVITTIITAITILILTFYLILESDALFGAFARLFPRPDRPRVKSAAVKISVKVGAWLSGQLILGGAIGLSAAVGLYLLGVPYFYVLSVIAAVGELIPIAGPVASAIPAILLGFTVSPQTALFTMLFFIAQQQVESHVLVPKIMQRQVGVSPVFVIVALLIGASLLGIVGAVLAVPTAAIVQVVVAEILDERDRMQDESDLVMRPPAIHG